MWNVQRSKRSEGGLSLLSHKHTWRHTSVSTSRAKRNSKQQYGDGNHGNCWHPIEATCLTWLTVAAQACAVFPAGSKSMPPALLCCCFFKRSPFHFFPLFPSLSPVLSSNTPLFPSSLLSSFLFMSCLSLSSFFPPLVSFLLVQINEYFHNDFWTGSRGCIPACYLDDTTTYPPIYREPLQSSPFATETNWVFEERRWKGEEKKNDSSDSSVKESCRYREAGHLIISPKLLGLYKCGYGAAAAAAHIMNHYW